MTSSWTRANAVPNSPSTNPVVWKTSAYSASAIRTVE
jgi:hypothetical protein